MAHIRPVSVIVRLIPAVESAYRREILASNALIVHFCQGKLQIAWMCYLFLLAGYFGCCHCALLTSTYKQNSSLASQCFKANR